MTDPKLILDRTQIEDADLGWTIGGAELSATFATGDFRTGLDLVNRIGAIAEEYNHHPDLLLTYPQVSVTLSSHDVGGVPSRDLRLAGLVNDLVEALGVSRG